jgi:hypothetical protein
VFGNSSLWGKCDRVYLATVIKENPAILDRYFDDPLALAGREFQAFNPVIWITLKSTNNKAPGAS